MHPYEVSMFVFSIVFYVWSQLHFQGFGFLIRRCSCYSSCLSYFLYLYLSNLFSGYFIQKCTYRNMLCFTNYKWVSLKFSRNAIFYVSSKSNFLEVESMYSFVVFHFQYSSFLPEDSIFHLMSFPLNLKNVI